MKTVAINAEYNPLHAGHAWQIAEVRKRSGADCLLVLMSGDFVQRGEPAIFDKYARAEAALKAGADLVLELPVAAATGSAQRFAEGAAAILTGLRGIDELWFGSEVGEIAPLNALAEILTEEPEAYREVLQARLREGFSFPAAREAALRAFDPSLPADLLSAPNNILGLEYLIALRKKHSPILSRTHRRIETASASEIRAELFAEQRADAVSADDFSSELRYQLLREDADSLTQYLDVAPDLARRIIKHIHLFRNFSQFAEFLDTKNRTRTSVMRALLHILLGITANDLEQALAPVFVRVLAKGNGDAFLAKNKAAGGLPVVANPANAFEAAYARDRFASELYESVLASRLGRPPIREYSRKLLLL